MFLGGAVAIGRRDETAGFFSDRGGHADTEAHFLLVPEDQFRFSGHEIGLPCDQMACRHGGHPDVGNHGSETHTVG
jgi:hypothetical protein